MEKIYSRSYLFYYTKEISRQIKIYKIIFIKIKFISYILYIKIAKKANEQNIYTESQIKNWPKSTR